MVPAAGPESELMRRHLQHPSNPGRLDHPDGAGTSVNPACGDELRIELHSRGGLVLQATFQASGCAATLAAGSAVTELLAGCSLDSVATEASSERVEAALGGLSPLQRHACVLASQAAVRAAAAARQKTYKD